MAKLMLILNAASVHDPLCSLLPEFVVRHYRYLRSSMPDLIPFVKVAFFIFSRIVCCCIIFRRSQLISFQFCYFKSLWDAHKEGE